MRIALVFAVLTIAGSPCVAQSARLPFVVGVWGQDDAIIPFAEFDGRRWRSSWPLPLYIERPPALEAIPPEWWGASRFSSAWEVMEPRGTRRTVRITGTRMARMGSSCSFTLASKLMCRRTPINTAPYWRSIARGC
jgi:hypothetical protein